MRPRLVIVSGAPGSGKTVLATSLSKALGLPLLTKDMIKEAMMDALPVPDRQTSMQMGAAVFRILYSLTQSLLAAGVGIVLEAPFTAPHAEAPLRELAGKSRAMMIQCESPAELAVERYRNRFRLGQRHPGHFDGVVLDGLAGRIQSGEFEAPSIDVATLVVDTREGYVPTLEEIVAWLEPA